MDYSPIIEYVRSLGPRLREVSGVVSDVGVAKKYLTEWDLRIERDLARMIHDTYGADHHIYAEEEHTRWQTSEHLWVIDPISGTKWFISGSGKYSVVVTHLVSGIPMFALVYDPTDENMYIAQKGQGVWLNDVKKTDITSRTPHIILQIWTGVDDEKVWKTQCLSSLAPFRPYLPPISNALMYCEVAVGKYAGIVSLPKDIFADIPGSLFIKESGKVFSTIDGKDTITPNDRIFVSADTLELHTRLLSTVRTCCSFE